MKKALPYVCAVFIAGSCYGLLVPIVKTAAGQGLVPYSFLPSQYLVALVITALICLTRKETFGSLRSMCKVAFLGVFMGCTSLCYFICITRMASAMALTLLFQYVWIGVIIDCVASRKLPDRTTTLSVIVVLIGTLFAAGIFESDLTGIDPLGLVAGLGSALFYALFLYFSRKTGTEYSVPIRTLMFCIGGFITSLLANPLYFTSEFLNAAAWPYAISLGLLGILIPISLIAFAAPKLSTSVVNVTVSSELPVGILGAWLVLGETPSLLTILGVVLVLSGIIINQLPTRDPRSGQR